MLNNLGKVLYTSARMRPCLNVLASRAFQISFFYESY